MLPCSQRVNSKKAGKVIQCGIGGSEHVIVGDTYIVIANLCAQHRRRLSKKRQVYTRAAYEALHGKITGKAPARGSLPLRKPKANNNGQRALPMK